MAARSPAESPRAARSHGAELATSEIAIGAYAQSGARDVVAGKREHGASVFETACSDCHARDEGQPGSSAPGLGGVGSRAYYLSFISNPKSALHMGRDASQMPRFDRELSLTERDALAEYLVWLRTATPEDLAALDAF